MIVDVTIRVLPDDGADQTTIAIARIGESVPQVNDFEQNMLRTTAKVSELAERATAAVLDQMEAHVAGFKALSPEGQPAVPRPFGRRPR